MKDLFAVYLCEAGGRDANLQGGLGSVRTRQKEQPTTDRQGKKRISNLV